MAGVDLAELEQIASLNDADACLQWLWRRRASADGDHAWCSKCNRERRFHRSRNRPSYSCDSCGHHVHPTAASLFEGSSTPLPTWIAAIVAMRQAAPETLSARDLATITGLPYTTSRRLHARILEEEREWRSQSAENDDIRTRLLSAAAASIAAHGYDGTRVKDIAAKANVAAATVLYHFDSRERILIEALDWASGVASERRELVLTRYTTRAEQLAQLIALAIPTTAVVKEEFLIWHEYLGRIARGELQAADSDPVNRFRGFFETVVAGGVAEGSFGALARDLDDLLEELHALIDGLALAVAAQRHWMPPERVARILARFTKNELGVDIEALTIQALLDGSNK